MEFSVASFYFCVAVFTGAISVYLFLWKTKRNVHLSSSKTNIPPGPWGFPILGHLPLLLGKDPWNTLSEWKRKYGNVFSISLAGQRLIVLNDLETSSKFLSLEEINGHFSVKFFDIYTELRGGSGINAADGKAWQEKRSFMVKSLAEFGTRDNKLQEQLELEAARLVEDLNRLNGKAVPMTNLLQHYTANATWRAIGTGSLDQNETALLIKAMKGHMEFNTTTDFLALLFPSFFARFTSVLDWRFQAFKDCKQMLETIMNKHLELRTPGQPRDIVDKYHDVVDKTLDHQSVFHVSSRSLPSPLMLDIILGSMDSASITMQWLMIYMLRDPEIQRKVQQELDGVVGLDRLPMLQDRPKLPFTEACVFEALRIRPVIPFAVPKTVTQDINVQGFFIPKDSLVMANIRGIHHDPEKWNQPDEFIPERFLAPDGSVRKDAKKMIQTFSTGKRFCPGERIAYNKLFLFSACILHSFNIKSDSNHPSTHHALGLLATPSATISVSFEPRNAAM